MRTMPTNEGSSGVSNCYVFKSRLQEYAQKAGLPTPVYETMKEGPSHEPSFRSTVIVKDARYDSLPGFFNRKAAEQSAAEVALVELAKAGEINESTSQPVHETGLCKNLLQEYAQKMNYAIPLYECEKDETPGRGLLFKCTVEIGGIRYIGASAKTKKEAEIKAARTALLAIQSGGSDEPSGNSHLTVIPCRKRGVETSVQEETASVPKPKKARFKKKMLKNKKMLQNKLSGDGIDNAQNQLTENLVTMMSSKDGQSGSESDKTDGSAIQGANCKPLAMEKTIAVQDGKSDTEAMETTTAVQDGKSDTEAMETTTAVQDGKSDTDLKARETSDIESALTFHDAGNPESGQSASATFNQSNHGTSAEVSAELNAGTGKVTGIIEVASMASNSVLTQIWTSNA